ncbi:MULTISPECIES: malonate decarboxylase holo-ACP synthase [Stutzerimonas stutzeri subgroup]|uniref:malonate decarboxylase holo-ACP synthase n=1 Tax=Stutzerimonas stutzeri subgroup TaxID=578833 RepID=UPI00052DB71E|nr:MULTISPECIES: malonate decarboxylase holo-ACP synthase [Stutzerimonas stutzeri subgroup]MBU0921119.1 malonate decarboxylase holo-ACP synthase [Gammaproteobacteria bacterium]MCQ2044637.1 malonate decarboxylase holo-ACP synthase [Stutzerimonas kunmingensis]CEG51801.1 phosphoribosyl-dephospho-CoA transferase (Holo-ACP synthase) [Stutzerimonas xanthomarina]SFJ34783.1 phosphoribosyl-dephospho-CoA transferase [Stutzerimonas kunmingensis]
MHDTPRPHDLLWGMRPEQLPADAPAWAVAVLAAGQPVVVRRARVAVGLVAVGLRGATRDQRLAALMPVEAISHRLVPEDLLARQASEDLPVFRVLAELRPLLDALGHAWGVTGSAGFQLATGLPTAHPDSDLDLLLRAERPLPRSEARPLLQLLEGRACRVDLQLETPLGGVALREWTGGAARVLVKTADGPRLVVDPWTAERAA